MANLQEAIDEKYTNNQLHSFKNKNIISCTDGEFQDREMWSFAKPNTYTVQPAACWNHIRQNLEFQMEKFHYNEEDKKQGDIDLMCLLNSETKDEYEDQKASLFTHDNSIWGTKEMSDYFEKNLSKKIEIGACFYLKEIGLQNYDLGCTSNAAESLNQLVKHQADGKEHTVGEQMLLFNYHQRLAAMECEMALYQRGPYKLKDEYRHLQKPIDQYPGHEIETVEFLTRKINDAMNVDTTNIGVEDFQDVILPRPAIEHIAEQIYKQAGIQLLTEDDKIIVPSLGDPNVKFIVDLSTMTCSCGMKDDCAHLRASLRKIGLAKDFGDPRRILKSYRTPKLTKAQKRRNFRDRKKAGRKTD